MNRALSPKAFNEIASALDECMEYFESRADAEYFPDSPNPVGNEEMRLLGEVGQARRLLGLSQVSA